MSRVYEYYQEGEQLPLDEQQQLEYLEWYNNQKQQENETDSSRMVTSTN